MKGQRSIYKKTAFWITHFSINEFELNVVDSDCYICLNDWEPRVKEIMRAGNSQGKKTVGIIEGINDFDDLDTGRKRGAYKTVKNLLLTGQDDLQYFPEQNVYVCGIPRLNSLLEERRKSPERPMVAINLNFTYNVLEDKREEWLKSILEVCKDLGVEVKITQHPADRGRFDEKLLSPDDMYTTIRKSNVLISRFSSAILESLAMDCPVIYHNPHEKK